MTVVYDAGVLVACDRSDRAVWAHHKARLEAGVAPITTSLVVAQVSRSPRQAMLRLLLRGCEIVTLSSEQAHRVGALLGDSRTSDIVDAHVAVVAFDTRSTVITGDVGDLQHLAGHFQPRLRVVGVMA